MISTLPQFAPLDSAEAFVASRSAQDLVPLQDGSPNRLAIQDLSLQLTLTPGLLTPLSDKEWEAAWVALADPDSARAFRAASVFK